MTPRALLLIAVLLQACAPLPQVTRVLGKTGATPPLLPLEQLPLATTATDPSPALAGRVAALRDRAAALRAR